MVANVSFTPPVSPSKPSSAGLPPAGGGDAFTKMLNQRLAEAEKPRDPSAEKVAEKPAEKSPEKLADKSAEKPTELPTEQSKDKTTEPTAEKLRSKSADKLGKKADGPAQAQGNTWAEATEGAALAAGALPLLAATDTHEAPATDPALTDWMASLHLPPPAPPAPEATALAGSAAEAVLAQGAGTDTGAAAAEADALGALSQAARPGTADATERAGPSPHAARAEAALASAAHDSANDFKSELARASTEASAELGPTAAAEAPVAGTVAHAAHASPLASAERSGHTAPTAMALPTPVNSPEFPQALGVQLSLLAKQGIQQAELQLNPPEMGPIAVQIALDGSKAQVDFTAASAATRQILENGLPELASALREAGLTLTGGGVFQQPRQSRQEGEGGREGGGRREAGAGRIDEPAAAPRRQVRVANGGVDLYA